jgi:serine/threonine protein kinase
MNQLDGWTRTMKATTHHSSTHSTETTMVPLRSGPRSVRMPGAAPVTNAFGRYEIQAYVGGGGMGAVYLAHDGERGIDVALKMPLHDQHPMRMMREAAAMGLVDHPNVVKVYEVGCEQGRWFLTMEYVKGQTLGAWLETPRNWREIIAVYADIAAALSAVHEAGLVHRDVKPSNVIIDADGRARLVDFGVSCLTNAQPQPADTAAAGWDLKLTNTGTWVGTPAFMSPEQFEGESVDARSDQFSMCVALYEALYGTRPFAGRTAEAIHESVLDYEPTEPPRTGVPPRVWRAIRRGLSKAPEQRFADMRQLMHSIATPSGWFDRMLEAIC